MSLAIFYLAVVPVFLASYANDDHDGLEPISRGCEVTLRISRPKSGLRAIVVLQELKACHSPNIILVTWMARKHSEIMPLW